MFDTRVQVDLIWLTSLLQDLLRPVSLLGWKDRVGLGCGDREWSFDGFEFCVLHERWMSTVTNIDVTRLQESNNVFSTEAVADSADFLKIELTTELV